MRRRHDEGNDVDDVTPSAHGVLDVRSASERVIEERAHPARTVAASLLTLSALVGLAGLLTFAILGLRMGFKMSDASPSATFVDFIYRISGPLMQPFQGIMTDRRLDSGGLFEPAAAYAMGIYIIATLFVMLMLWAVVPRWIVGRSTVVRRVRVAHQH